MKKLFRAVKKDGTLLQKYLDPAGIIPKCWTEVKEKIKKEKKKSKKRGKK